MTPALFCVLEILAHGNGTPAARVCHANEPARHAAFAIMDAHREYPSVPVSLVAAVIAHESGFRAEARGAAGEYGLMQLLRGGAITGALESVRDSDLLDPRVNVLLGTRYLAAMQRRCGPDPRRYLSAYNGGGCRRRFTQDRPYATKVLHLLKGPAPKGTP